MHTKVSFWSRGKLLLLGSALFMASFIFGGQANAGNCYWTASSSLFASNMNNWDNGSGTACTGVTGNILFVGTGNGSTTANLVFNLTTTTSGVVVNENYTGNITFNGADITIASGDFDVRGTGSVTIDSTSTLSIGRDLAVSSTAFTTAGVLNVTGTTTVTSTLTFSAGTTTLFGNLIVASGGVFNGTGGNFYASGASSTLGGSGTATFYNLTVTGTVVALNGNVTTTNDLTINDGGSFNLKTFTLRSGGNIATNGTTTQGAGTIVMTGTSKTLGGTKTAYADNLTISGTVTLVGDLAVNTTLTINSTKSLSAGGNTIFLAGAGTPFANYGTFNANTSTFRYTGSSPAISPTSTYYNLISVGTGTHTIAQGDSGISVTNQLQVASAVLNLGSAGTHSVTGTVLIASGAALIANGATLLMDGTGNLGASGVISLSSLTINGTTTLNGDVTSSVYLTINSGATLVASGYNVNANLFSVAGTLTQTTSGAVNLKYNTGYLSGLGNATVYNLNVSDDNLVSASTTVAGVLTVSAGKTLTTASNNTITFTSSTPLPFALFGTSVFSPALGTTVVYAGASQTIASTTYANLTINNSTAGTLTGSTTVKNSLLVNSGKTLSAGGSQLTLQAINTTTPLTISGTFTANTSTVVFTSSTSVNVPSTTYYNLTLDASTSTLVSGSNNVKVNGVLVVNSGKVLNAGSNVTLELAGTGTPLVMNGTLVSGGTAAILYTGSTFNIATTTYSNLWIDGNGEGTLAGNATTTVQLSVASGSSLTQTSGTFIMSGTSIAAAGVKNFYNLTLSTTTISAGNVTTTNVLTVSPNSTFTPGSATIYLTGTGTPFVLNGNFTRGTSNVVYSGAAANIASTTYYDLTINNSTAGTLTGSTTVSDILTINASKTLSASSYQLTLSASTTPFVIGSNGTFNSNSSTVVYSSTGSVTTTGGSYWTLTLGSGTYNLGGNSTSSNAFTNGGTLNVGNYDLAIANGTYTNSGTVTVNGTGVIRKEASGGMTATSYTSGTGNGTGNSITITVTDPTSDLSAASADTKNVTMAASNYSDSETVGLTETGANTGIFTGTIYFNIGPSAASNGKLDVSGNGTLTLTYTNGYGTLSGANVSATYSGSNFASGGGSAGGGGSSSSGSSATPVGSVSLLAGAKTTSQTITLNFSVTNASDVALSEDPGFSGANWEKYVPSKSFVLSKGAGQKTVYVKFRSSAGTMSATYKVSVTLESGYQPVMEAPKSNTAPMAVPVSSVSAFSLSNPLSKVVILPVKKLEYKPNSSVPYTYKFTNDTSKTVKVKVVRQVIDEKGKVIASVTGSASVAKGKTFTSKAVNFLNSKLVNGTYTIKVQVLDFKTGKLIDQNSFDVTVKKPLPPPPPPSISTNNPDSKVVITGLKVDYKPGSAVKYTYSYKNETTKPLKVKIVRQVVDANGKVVSQADGTRTLSKGQKMSFNATSALSKKLAVGTYTVKVKLLDAKNVVLDENGFDFVVKK